MGSSKTLVTDIPLLKGKIKKDRPNETMKTYSYSKVDLFSQCRYKYYLKYVLKKVDDSNAIYLDLGTLIHRILEEKGNLILQGIPINYDKLKDYLINGFVDTNEKSREVINGTSFIKKKFFDDYYTADNKSGMNYVEKVDLFFEKILPKEMEDSEWKVFKTEFRFDFIYTYKNSIGEAKEARIHGFIDRIDINDNGDFRVVDYKTSKDKYDDKKMATPLQMAIYSLAIFNEFGKLPIEHLYVFVFRDIYQDACTKGYIKRACNKLDKILNEIDELELNKKYKPSPSPLCYFCAYCDNNPTADPNTKRLCPYYSLWTRSNKTFEVNKKWGEDNIVNDSSSGNKTRRKLIF